jgi:hypothetical protein
MREEEFDRILSKKQEIIPSPGFVVSVMDAVRREAAALAPIAFPWKRALPGMIAAGLALVWCVVVGVKLLTGGNAIEPPPAKLLVLLGLLSETWRAVGASWILLALVSSLASVKLSMRYAYGKRW